MRHAWPLTVVLQYNIRHILRMLLLRIQPVTYFCVPAAGMAALQSEDPNFQNLVTSGSLNLVYLLKTSVRFVLACGAPVRCCSLERFEDDLGKAKSFPICHSCSTFEVAVHFLDARGLSTAYRATELYLLAPWFALAFSWPIFSLWGPLWWASLVSCPTGQLRVNENGVGEKKCNALPLLKPGLTITIPTCKRCFF